MRPYFIFNNISSLDYLSVNKLPSIYKPAKDIKKIEIEGRDGFLTEDNGSYRGILKTVQCTIKDIGSIDFISNWLSGNGDVIFSNEPDKIYKATIIEQIEFSKIIKTWHSFIIQFDCQPHKLSITDDVIPPITVPQTIYNPGTANSKPIIKVYGTGDISLTINGNTVNLTGIVDYVTIDSDFQDCYKDADPIWNNHMSGEFPELIPGDNTISWTGTVTKIEITPNWRW